ncbi:MAG: hypothetical protein KDD33_10580 [Bdellovibrionales bacterium]|nr:hypothetical protein [Bdellovibrionales bacterium]
MGNTAIILDHSVQTQPKRILHYRPHIKWCYYGLIALAIVSSLQSVLTLAYFASNGRLADMALPVIILSTLPILFLFLAEQIFKPMAFTATYVFTNKLVLDRMGERVEIPFDDIQSIQFNFVAYTGGLFRLVLKNGRSRYFTVVLERSDYILDAIADYKPEIIDEKKLTKFRRTAVVIDHSWARIYDLKNYWRTTLLAATTNPIIVIGAFSLYALMTGKYLSPTKAVSLIAGFSLLNLAIMSFTTGAREAYLSYQTQKQIKAQPNNLMRDRSKERTIRLYGMILHHIVFWVAVLLIFIY